MSLIVNHDLSAKSDYPPYKTKGAELSQFILAISIVLLLGIVFIFGAFVVKFILMARQADPAKQVGDSVVWIYELAHFLALEVGIGFITACVIAITVEVFMRNREKREHEQQKEEISQSVFFALFRTAVPGELIAEMYKALFLPNFIRENLEIKYTFISLPGEEFVPIDNRRLILRQAISFKAQNVTDKSARHLMGPRDEVLIRHDGYPIAFREFLMEVVVPDNSSPSIGQKVHLYGDNLRANITMDGMRQILKTQEVLVYPAQYVNVLIVLEKVCRYSDMDTWVTANSAKDLKLIVELSDEQFSILEFCVDQAHRQPLRKVPSSETHAPNSYTWRLDYAVLPYQGVMLRWRPRPIMVYELVQVG